ncbi:hypothetical protein ACF1A5_07430 [Streptomyces sp. NPDC014864]|uniref:hypothetical protein n=1 Tax=Streptomyces sp. NPDC014864 TaxID=3364924 RepID=UPI0036FAA293
MPRRPLRPQTPGTPALPGTAERLELGAELMYPGGDLAEPLPAAAPVAVRRPERRTAPAGSHA